MLYLKDDETLVSSLKLFVMALKHEKDKDKIEKLVKAQLEEIQKYIEEKYVIEER